MKKRKLKLKSSTIRTILMALALLAGVFASLLAKGLFKSDLITNSLIIITIALPISLLLIRFLISFLEGRSTRDGVREHLSRVRVKNIVSEHIIDSTNWKSIQDTIENKIDSITSEKLFDQVKEKYESRLVEDIRVKVLEMDLAAIKSRVDLEIDRTSRNSIVNLIIGIVMTTAAVIFLVTSVIGLSSSKMETNDFLIFVVPRISIVLLVELFSFFFLRLYRRNLEDMKYLNNELTNIDLKLIALRASIVYEDDESRKFVIQELAKTERNFVLKKGESTVDIKLEEQNGKNTELLMNFFKTANSK